MPGICKTKQKYIDDGFIFIERPDGTVALFNDSNNPVNDHETKPCCELLGYTFDIENQKCRWVPNINSDELFKVVLNPDGNSSTLFEVEENETCSLEVSFDYLFLFKCDDLITAKAKAIGIQETTTSGGVTISAIANQLTFDNIEANISTLTSERDFYQSLVDAPIPPFVLECSDGGASDPSSFFGASSATPWLLTPGVVNYCLTTEGLTQWKSILDAKDLTYYDIWYTSNGTDTTTYDCTDINNLLTANETSTDPLIEESCNYTIFDKDIALTTKQNNQDILDDVIEKLEDEEDKLETFKTEMGLISPTGDIVTDTNCDEYINILENFDTSFSVEVLSPDGTALNTVYEEELINIGSGNLYNYIDSTSGKTGILISGDTRLMPTVEETELFGLPDDLCSQVRDTLVTDIFDEYLVDNPFPSTEVEKRNLYKKLTGWYQSSWLQYKTVITDESVISLLENKEVNISVSINNTCVNFSILLDRIKMNKICTKVDNVKRFISEPPKFELTRTPDNQKSWLANTTRDYRYSNLKYRGTEYNTNHHKLVVNTKEVDLTLSPSRAVEQDVWCYVSDNNCILEGCISSGETYSAFTCPSGYTLDIDGNSCTKLTTTGVTTSATTYTIGAGVGLTKAVHSLSRGTIFIEDITDKTWPIYWTGTTKDSWVGPYYNVDYLVDYSGNYLNHTGFGSNTFTDGSIQYASPNAFSGIKSEYGKNNSSIYGGKLNPNILWGGTDGSVSGTPYVNISNTDNAGRLLNASIWSTGLTPTNEWIGVSYCFELTETKVYRLGFAGDDDVRIKVNGNYIFNSVITPSHDINIYKNFSESYSRTAQSYLVVGISLPAGKNIIEVEGYNTILGVSGFVLEVYDATEAELKNMRYETELNSVRVFSTADRIGQTFDLGEQSANSCPTGYAYDNCNPGSTSCLLIERTFRKAQQLDEYCPCPTYPLIVKDYSGTTTELPLTASTTTLNCDEIITLVSNYDTTTTLKDVDVIKGRSAYALGTETTTTFNGFWITEENDGTIGLYDVNYSAGTNSCSCPAGYTPTTGNNGCQSITSSSATFNGSTGSAVSIGGTLDGYGQLGTSIYPDASTLPNLPLTRTATTSALEDQLGTIIEPTQTITSNTFWQGIDATTGRLNNVGVSASTTEYLGFSHCIDVPVAKTYYIGIGASRQFRITIDGQIIIDNDYNSTINFRQWQIISYYLTPGKHIIEMEGKTDFRNTFGAEIYNPTDLATLTGATNTTDAGVIFSTANKVGSTFDLGTTLGYSCPAGSALNTCNAGTPVCSVISSTGITCTAVPASSSYQNVSSQITYGCCKAIDDAFTAYTETFKQGVDTYPSISWDNNKKKCVYRKCGDNGCIDLDDVLTTELSAIDTVKEFASTLSSELIDAKNRKTLNGYPTLRMLYDRYNTRSEEFCGNLSSKYDYFDMDKFGKTVGNYWIDLIEQVVPATTIWGSTYAYKNTVFDQQKFNYRHSNIYFGNPPIPETVIDAAATLDAFDYLVLEYIWEPFTDISGNIRNPDLDIKTSIKGLTTPGIDKYVGYGGYSSLVPAKPRASATISGGEVTGVVITDPSFNYSTPPTVTIINPSGTDYTSPPTVNVNDINFKEATATAVINIATGEVISINDTYNFGYTSAPTVTISGGGGAGATATATINTFGTITGYVISNPGAGYSSAPTVTISGGGVRKATATSTVSGGEVTGFVITDPGIGYTSAPFVYLSGGGCGYGASATAAINGSGELSSITLNSGSGASATATINGSGQITSIGVDTPGSGYVANPIVKISTDPYLEWGGDCLSCPNNSEHVLINFKKLADDVPGTDLFKIELNAHWNSGLSPMIAAGVVPNVTINMTTYEGGIMTRFCNGYTVNFPNVGGAMKDNENFITPVYSDVYAYQTLGHIEYNKTTKEAVLIDASVPPDVTVISTTASLSPPTPPLLYAASASTVGVIIEELPKPITTTDGIFTTPPSIVRTEGVWIKETGCGSDFLGEVTTIDKYGAIIPS